MIKLSKPNDNVHKFIDYYKNISKPNPLGKTRYIDYPKGIVLFYLSSFGKYVYITELESNPQNSGLGSEFMKQFCKDADKFKVEIYLHPSSFNSMGNSKLKEFYRKFNFVNHGSDMIRKLKTTSSIETDFEIPDWFKEKTNEAQDQYLEDHPHSKLAKSIKKQKEKPDDKKSKPDSKGEEKKDSGIKVIKNAKDYLKDNGSPTGFTGPKSKDDSYTGNVKAERYVSALLNKLADLTDKAIAEGKEVPDYDLCEVQVPGTNLFCEVNLGVPRKLMPQLKGKPDAGSWGDKNLEKDGKGEVDGEKAFRKLLEKKGVNVQSKQLPANSLKATQNQLVGSKVAGMTKALEKDPHNPGITAPIFVSKDGYILDGHHRWAAQVGLGIKSGIKAPILMDAEVVDMTMEELLSLTNDFCEQIGIKPKAGKAAEHSSLKRIVVAYIESKM